MKKLNQIGETPFRRVRGCRFQVNLFSLISIIKNPLNLPVWLNLGGEVVPV